MGKAGKVATGAKRTKGKAVKTGTGYFRPSYWLTAKEKTYWKYVVSSFPENHFCEADRVLMEQLCQAAVQNREATLAIQLDGLWYTDKNGRRRPHPAVELQHQARVDCSMLATKLRITKQAQISPKMAGRKAQDGAEAVKVQGDDFSGLMFSPDQKDNRIQ